MFLYLFTIVLQQALTIGTNLWLRYWSGNNSETGDNGNLTFYLGIYAAFGVTASLVFLANGLILYSYCVIRSAKTMHDGMFYAVMRSPMLFFETTPLGTILNRFSRDVYVIDEVLARVFGGFFRTMAGVIGKSSPPVLSAADSSRRDGRGHLQCGASVYARRRSAHVHLQARAVVLPRHLARAEATRRDDQVAHLRLVPGDPGRSGHDPRVPPESPLRRRE